MSATTWNSIRSNFPAARNLFQGRPRPPCFFARSRDAGESFATTRPLSPQSLWVSENFGGEGFQFGAGLPRV